MTSRLAPVISALGLLSLSCMGAPGEMSAPGPLPAGGNSGAGAGAGGNAPGPADPALPMPTPAECQDGKLHPGRAPLRRLTRFEYDNTVRDLLGDTTSPASALPAEEVGNGFGNDAATQAVSSLLAEQYARVAEQIAARATQPGALGKLHPCAATAAGTASEESCARQFIDGFAARAFRRSLGMGEADGLLALYRSTRALGGASFATAVGAVIEAVLQSPDFLYRVEVGENVAGAAGGLRRPTGDEMATRLSYFLWGTLPDEPLRAAARAGTLSNAAGVRAQATRLLADPRAHQMVRFFFDNLLPISGLTDLDRDKAVYPQYTPALGALMREETQRLLEFEIFEGGGTWAAALTAPHTFVNGPLAAFYGLPASTSSTFRKVELPRERLGFLTHASLMAGTTHSNHTNPVVRGAFVAGKLLCLSIPLPDASIAEKVKPPDPYAGKTARERFTKHRADPVCAGCHQLMDPIGLALENFDALGLYRTQENGVTIDASGEVPGTQGTVDGPVALVRKLATAPAVQTCFARHWLELAYGKSSGPEDVCAEAALRAAFAQAGFNVKQLLLALTQTDAFLYRGGE